MKRKTFDNYLTEGVLISFFSILSYVIAFKYEAGICNFWNIPTYFIEISITTIISAGVSLFSSLLMLLIFLNPVIPFFSKQIYSKDPLKVKTAIINLFIIVFLFITLTTYGFSVVSIILTFMVFFYYVAAYIFPWFVDKEIHPGKTSMLERRRRYYSDANDQTDTFEDINFFQIFLNKFGTKAFFLVLVAIPFALTLSGIFGYRTAKYASQYLYVEKEGLIIIKKYGPNYFLKHYDPKKKNVSEKLYIWQDSNLKNYGFSKIIIKSNEKQGN